MGRKKAAEQSDRLPAPGQSSNETCPRIARSLSELCVQRGNTPGFYHRDFVVQPSTDQEAVARPFDELRPVRTFEWGVPGSQTSASRFFLRPREDPAVERLVVVDPESGNSISLAQTDPNDEWSRERLFRPEGWSIPRPNRADLGETMRAQWTAHGDQPRIQWFGAQL